MKEYIEHIREKLEPFRFYLLRFIRVYLLFYLYTFTTESCALMLGAANDPEQLNYNPLFYHGMSAAQLLIVFILFAGIFILYDPTARRHFCKNPPKEKNIFSEWLQVLKSYEFLCDVIGFIVFPLIHKTTAFTHPLWLYFGREDFTQWQVYGLYLVTVLPILLIADWILRVRTRRFWRDLTWDEAKDKHLDALALFFLSILILFVYPYISGFYAMTIFLLIGLLIAVLLMPMTLLSIAAVIFALWTLFVIRAMNIRRKFLRRLKKICKKENIEISKIKHPYLSIILRKNHDFHFTVKRGDKTYACKMIAAVFKSAPMIFLDEDIGYFKFGFRFRGNDVVFLRPKFYHSFDAEGADHKVLIISPVPHEIRAVSTQVTFQSDETQFITESKRFRVLDNASALYDSTLFSGDGFINALMRDCLDKNSL